MPDTVAIMRAKKYDVDQIVLALERAFAVLGHDLPRSSRVLLKPNALSQNTPSQCTTTHPAVIEAVCALLSDRGNSIIIGESSAFYQGGHTARAFRTSGIADVAKRFDADLVAFEEGPIKLVKNEGRSPLSDILVSALVDDVDSIVNIPKLKTHAFFRMSGAVKNLFGFVPGGAKYEYHFVGGTGLTTFAEKIADIWLQVKPELSIMDAICGLDGYGPAAMGSPRNDGLLLVSENPWALDWIAAGCMGFLPEDLPGCAVGVRRGYLKSPSRIAVLGDYSKPPVSFWKPAPSGSEKPKAQNTFYHLVSVHPALRRGRCTSCGQCLASCPLGAIDWFREPSLEHAKKYPAVDLSRCLRCYHCVYACPECAWRLVGDSRLNLPVRALRKLLRL